MGIVRTSVTVAAWLGVCSLPALSPPAEAGEPPLRFRDLVAEYFEEGNGEKLAEAVGWQDPVKTVVALEYKIVLVKDGKEEMVDPKAYGFKVGDQIRLVVQPFTDSYVYIFHQGASGKAGLLVPRENEEPPRVAARQTITLPRRGLFEFVSPPGDEKIVVVAAEKPVADRQTLIKVLAKPPEKDTPEEARVRASLNASVEAVIKTVQEREQELRNQVVKFRGVAGTTGHDEMVEDVRRRAVTRGTVEEPGRNADEGTVAMYISLARDAEEGRVPNLVVTIPLKSSARAPSP